MKIVGALAAKLVLISTLLLSSTIALALETYDTAGFINKLGIGYFNIQDQKYWITPTTKISIQEIDNAQFSDLKPGDSIFVKGYSIGERHYADVIIYVPTKSK